MKSKLLFFLLPLTLSCSPALTEQEAMSLIRCVPDHHNWGPEESFTEEYYSLLVEAWAVPNDDPCGDIGSGEFLSYFMSGNGDVYDRIEIKSIKSDGNRATVNFDCVWPNSRHNHSLNLVYSGKWIIEDFDGTKQEMLEYIRTSRDYFRSDRWPRSLDEVSEYCSDQRERLEKDVSDYFLKYPEDR